jgi:predicted acetyltransferase
MPESNKPPLASIEADLFGTIFGFHKKFMTLLRESSLDDEKENVVADRIKALLGNVTAEMDRKQQLNVAERLEAIYEEARRLVDELSV